MKKILYIHHGKGLGGAPLSLLYLVLELNKKIYKPIVLFLYKSDAVDLFKSYGIKIIGPIFEHDFPHTKIWWYKWYHVHHLIKSIYSQIKTIFYIASYWYKKIKPDIVHLNTSSLIGWAIAAKKANIPIVWHIREPLADGYFGIRKKLIKKIIARYATKIVPICKNDAKPWIDLNKTNIIYNPVNKNIFYPREKNSSEIKEFIKINNIPFNAKTILFLGGLSVEKGTHIILESFIRLKKILPISHLIMAGYFDLDKKSKILYSPSDKYKKYISNLIKKEMNSITILGPINNVPIAMAASNIIVFPATVGHFARPLIEAGFMSKPSLASKIEGVNEIIKDGETGFLIEPSDYNKWTDALFKLITNEELALKIGNNAFDHCLKNFSSELHVQKIENCYKETLNY